MGEKAFRPGISTTRIRTDLLSKANSRIIYCAPGISEIEIKAILQAQDNHPDMTIQLLLDVSAISFSNGYWGELSPNTLQKYEKIFIHSNVANDLRLGILIIDNLSWIYTPTPQSIEFETSGREPNALELNEMATRLLSESLLAQSSQPGTVRPRIDSAELAAVQREIIISGTPSPGQRREIDIIRPLLKIIQFEVRGYKLTQHRIQLPREIIDIIGSSDREINERINADWKMFSDDEVELLKIQKNIEREIEGIKNQYLVRFGHFGFGLGQQEREGFLRAWKHLEDDKIPAFKEAIKEKYSAMVARSQSMLRKLLEERINSGTLQIPNQKSLLPLSAREGIEIFLDKIIKRVKWPSEEAVLEKLEITYREFDISERLLSDPKFISFFEIQFGSIDSIVRRAYPKPTRPATDGYHFSLN